jgi:hypothetical protein
LQELSEGAQYERRKICLGLKKISLLSLQNLYLDCLVKKKQIFLEYQKDSELRAGAAISPGGAATVAARETEQEEEKYSDRQMKSWTPEMRD